MKTPALSVLIVVAVLLLASGLYVGMGAGEPSGAPTGSLLATGHSPSRSTLPAAPTPPSASSSGRGTFFLNYPQPTAPATNLSCRYLWSAMFPACTNDTGNPSIATTPTGGLVTAYTAFADANPCSAAANLTASVIGVDTSKNGTIWAAPIYLDNPVCSDQFNYSSAMMPAIASLPNGTLVLAYVEYNLSANASGVTPFFNCEGDDWYPAPLPCIFTDARLVVTESYNGGSTWTVPSVIVSIQNTSVVNASGVAWIPMLPSIAVTGDTVYLAWSNLTNVSFGEEAYFGGNPIPPSLVSVELVTSTSGGTSWSPPATLPTVDGVYDNGPTSVAYAPSLAVAANGTLYVAYSTNFTADDNLLCNPYSDCGFPEPGLNQSMDVVVAQSIDNGSTFSVSTAASAVPVYFNGLTWITGYPGSIVAPAPSIAIDPTTGQLYVAYAGGEIGNICFGTFCNAYEDFENVWLASSTDNGGTWTNAGVGDQALTLAAGSNESEFLMTPSVGVGTGGTVYVNAVNANDTVCNGYQCDQWTDLLFESTDHGATFSSALEVAPLNASIDEGPLWDGFTTSMTMVGGVPWFAWTQQIDPSPLLNFCFGPSLICYSQVIVSTLFTGTGLTTTLNETGLPTGYNWTVAVEGNVRTGPAGTNLSVSGVPVGENLSWSVPYENSTTEYGIRYAPLSVPSSPYVQTANLTIDVTFEEEALVNISAIPVTPTGIPFSCGSPYFSTFYQYDCANVNVTPTVGLSYAPVGVPLAYGAAPIPGFSFMNCNTCLNVSFVAWTGVGNGSWNSTISNGTTTIYGPVNETVSFNILAYCSGGLCSNATYNYTFVETGLPSGTSWTMTFGNQTETSDTSLIGFNGSGGPIPFTVWAVPDTGTMEYVGTASPPSPITALQDAGELVNFQLESIGHGSSTLSVSATGLPAGVTSWGFSVGSTLHGTPASGGVYTVANVPIALNATSVYGPDGIGAYPTGFSVTPEITGSTTTSLALGGTLVVTSPVEVTAHYSPEYWLTVANSTGGSVSAPAGQWIHGGLTVNLTATALAGYAFVGWTGAGLGSVTSTAATIAVHPTGPVSELATFVAVTPTFALSVSATGVLSGVPITVSVGEMNYTEVAPFVIPGLTAGSYSVSIPTVYPNGTSGERFVTTSVTSSLPLTAGSVDVTANGTLAITYAEEVTLSVGGSTNGTTDPVAGTYWETDGVSTPLTATPDTGFVFVSWNGTGLGSVTTSSSASIALTPTGPVTEAAVFAPRVIPAPATFTLTLSETGLPTGTTWSASIGANGASGTGDLVLTGLNGTYTVVVSNVLGSVGVRYVPGNATGYSSVVTTNTTLSVTFTTQYSLSVAATAGGTVTPSSEWVDSGGTVTLAATPSTSYEFTNWSGTGTGAYSGTNANPVLTVTGPVSEIATFVPTASLSKSSSSSGGSELLAIALLLVLLVVGLVVGLLIARLRPPSSEGASKSEGLEADTSNVPVWTENTDAAETPSPAPPPGSAEDESIYGGGSA
ncbi:MAG: hypothetical protein WB852_04325 [Thermoplasmata archaeon]